jgi:hypothetical protein
MTPGKLTLTIYQGSTFRRVVRLADDAGGAIDLTGATARMHVRAAITDTATLLELTEANGRALVTDAVGGEITLLVSAADTALLTFTTGVYDLEIEYSDGTVDRVLYGKVTLSKEVTR